MTETTDVVDRQVAAYRGRDLERFLGCYAADVKIRDFDGTVLMDGLEAMRGQYGPLFRTYSTATITPELLAALAQVESSGNPVTRTYWRWRWSFNPFAIYQPASSAVGLFQMIDGAYAEAAKFCIRDHAVTDSGCGFTGFYIRTIPSHSIEPASIYLDRNVAAVLARAGTALFG